MKIKIKSKRLVYSDLFLKAILEIFENTVLKSVSQFKTAYLVLNCPLIFGKDNQVRFALYEDTFTKIINRLSQLGEFRVTVSLFKLPNTRIPQTKESMEKSKANLQYEAQEKIFKGTLDRSAVPYDNYYSHKCLAKKIESPANPRKSKFFFSR